MIVASNLDIFYKRQNNIVCGIYNCFHCIKKYCRKLFDCASDLMYYMFDIMYNIYYAYIHNQALKFRDFYVLALFCIPRVLLKLLTSSF